jgi:undecaprenol kinase
MSPRRAALAATGKAPPGTPPPKRILRSFRFAARGVVYLFRTQPNVWVHGLAAVLVVVFATWLERTPAETGVLLLAIGLVLAAEALNTAVEAVVDLVSPEYHDLARVAKDTAAGGVLLAALTAALVGLVILGPPLLRRLVG